MIDEQPDKFQEQGMTWSLVVDDLLNFPLLVLSMLHFCIAGPSFEAQCFGHFPFAMTTFFVGSNTIHISVSSQLHNKWFVNSILIDTAV